jgi:hypothetical protein
MIALAQREGITLATSDKVLFKRALRAAPAPTVEYHVFRGNPAKRAQGKEAMARFLAVHYPALDPNNIINP